MTGHRFRLSPTTLRGREVYRDKVYDGWGIVANASQIHAPLVASRHLAVRTASLLSSMLSHAVNIRCGLQDHKSANLIKGALPVCVERKLTHPAPLLTRTEENSVYTIALCEWL